MNISQISIPINIKKADSKTKGEAQLGKVISKNGKEIQVLIKDKVYKIEPGNAGKIKTGDMIQVFFGKDLPQEVSSEVLKKIGAKLIDVYSLSLPFKTSQELETLINKMPQSEKMRFAHVSNQISNLAESILKEDFNIEIKESVENTKNAFDLYDSRLPFNRRLIEISLKAKAMGMAWDYVPDKIKKEIIKEFVLFDFKKILKGDSEKTEILSDSGKKESGVLLQNIQDESEKGNHSDKKIKSSDSKLIEPKDKPSFDKPFPHKNVIKQTAQHASETLLKPSFSLNKTSSNKGMVENKEQPPSTFTGKAVIQEENQTSNTVNTEKNRIQKQITGTVSKHISDVKYQSTQTDPASKEELIKNTVNELKGLLKELISKPINLEKNHENLNHISEKFESLKISGNTSPLLTEKVTHPLHLRLEETIKQNNLPLEDKNILTVLNKLVKAGNEEQINFESIKINREVFSRLISKEFSFETIKNDPMLKFEIKNILRQLNGLGIPPKETVLIANDIVNIAVRSFKEPDTAQNIFPNSLKNYLKLKLPQLIIDNKVAQSDERPLISRIQSFSQKAYIIVKDFVQKLISSPDDTDSNRNSPLQSQRKMDTSTQVEMKQETTSKSAGLEKNSQIKNDPYQETKQLTKQPKEIAANLSSSEKKQIVNTLEESKSLNARGKEVITLKNNIAAADQEKSPVIKDDRTTQETTLDSKLKTTEDKPLQSGLSEKNEINSEKLLKMLNITSDKNEFNHVYSALLNFNGQPFAVDFQKQSVNKSGYDKTEMYRVYIETDTQRFGNVFIDTIVSGENLDIYIYAGQEHTGEFTNHSSVLSKRIKETDYKLRSLLIREKANQNDILKHKVKLYTDNKRDGGFIKLA
jgi:hypothetical protein